MGITRIELERFTAFEKLDINFSPGMNVFIGENGTGKTHLLKVMYAACDAGFKKTGITDKLIKICLPSNGDLGRLVHRKKTLTQCNIKIYQNKIHVHVTFESNHKGHIAASENEKGDWDKSPIKSAYIPVKEILSNAPGFRSLYHQREVHFEEFYDDILNLAYLPQLRRPFSKEIQIMLNLLEDIMGGGVTIKGEEFFLNSKQGNIEFSLLAEGFRKLGLLWLLLCNGSIRKGSVLFWDEPESNLNPKLYGPLINILLELQRQGVQIFIATHDYVILKELDLRLKESDKILFHSLYKDDSTGDVLCNSTDDFLQIEPNAIQDTFLDLFDRDIVRDLEDE